MPLIFTLITNILKYFFEGLSNAVYVWCWILLRYWLFFLFHKVNPRASSSNRKRRTKRKLGKLICDRVFHTVIAQMTWITRNLSCLKCISHKSLSGFQKTWCTTERLKKLNTSSIFLQFIMPFFPNYNIFSITIITLLGNIQQRKKKDRDIPDILLCHCHNKSKCLCAKNCQHRQFVGRVTE